jgi:hypothetical protein
MATNMTIAMSAWMRYRGHRWAATAEMAAAMYLPFIVLLFPLWLDYTGTIGGILPGSDGAGSDGASDDAR